MPARPSTATAFTGTVIIRFDPSWTAACATTGTPANKAYPRHHSTQ